ncbi:MAG TPA: LCP family protein [Acidimicrobiales bacterium]|nr:LCP family protein [Acidimicrobiales bacterium]
MSSPTRHRRRSPRQKVLLSIGVVVALVCMLGAAGVVYAYVRYSSITRYDVALPPAAEGEPRNFLLVGSDSREGLDPTDADYAGFVTDGVDEGAGQRTDTIMVLRVDPDTEQADLLSLPRDLYLPIGGPDGSKDRINAAFAQDRQTLIDTIQSGLGIPIHHYVEVDFGGFKDMVGAIGGVDVSFDAALRDPNTGLDISSPGCVSLGPTEALQFVRSRHLEIRRDGEWVSDPTGDLGRITRQQLFIRQAVGKALSKGLTNPVRLNELVGVGVDNVGLDPGLGATDLLSFGRRFASFDESTLHTYTPVVVPFRTSAGASVLDLDEEASDEILNLFRGLPPGSISPEFVSVTVLNGGAEDGRATDVASALGQIGFTIDVIGDSDEAYPRSAIYFAPGSESAALQLVSHLTSRPELLADEALGDREVVLVIGPDFTTVHQQATTEDLSGLVPASTTSTTDSGDRGEATTTTTVVNGYLPGDDSAFGCG